MVRSLADRTFQFRSGNAGRLFRAIVAHHAELQRARIVARNIPQEDAEKPGAELTDKIDRVLTAMEADGGHFTFYVSEGRQSRVEGGAIARRRAAEHITAMGALVGFQQLEGGSNIVVRLESKQESSSCVRIRSW